MQLQIFENKIIKDNIVFIPKDLNNSVENTNNAESDILKHINLINLIKHFEGFKPKAYVCEGGKWTIGYGTTIYMTGKAVKEGETKKKRTGGGTTASRPAAATPDRRRKNIPML